MKCDLCPKRARHFYYHPDAIWWDQLGLIVRCGGCRLPSATIGRYQLMIFRSKSELLVYQIFNQ